MNKLVCLGLSLLDVRKIVMYDFWRKNMEKKQNSYMATGSFILYGLHKNM